MGKFAAAVLIGLSLGVAAIAVAERSVPFHTVVRDSEGDPAEKHSGNAVIRDSASWTRLWRELHRYIRPRPPVPRVDFSRRMLIAVRLGPSGGGDSIRVTSIVDDGRRLVVKAEVRKPGDNCIVPAVLTAPYHVVSIRRTAKPAVFRRHVTVYDC